MLDTAGTKLRRARTLRQLSLEDAARATKIRVSQLADLERDEYSNFANLAYAKGFLISYGKYLHVDVRSYLEAFADASTFGLDDYQYLSDAPVGVYRAPTRPWRRQRNKQGRLLLAGTALALAVVAMFAGFLYVSYQRLGDLGKLAEHQAASEQRRTGGEPAKPAAPAAPAAAENAPAPVAVPVSATPVPAPAPEIAPSSEDTRAAATALAISEHSPTALLTQLALPAVRVPGAQNPPLDAGGKPLAPPAPGNDPLFVHAPDPNANPFRQGEPKPQKVSNNAVE